MKPRKSVASGTVFRPDESASYLLGVVTYHVPFMTEDRQTGEPSTDSGAYPGIGKLSRTFVIGICMGSADAVPGVSGGTIALIAGVYGRLIGMVTSVTPGRLLRLLGAVTPYDGRISRRKALEVWDELDGWFGISLVTGVLVAVVTVTRIVHVTSRSNPTLLFGFLFGLIAASAIVLLRELEVETVFQAGIGIVGFVVAFLLSGSATFLEGGGLIVFFASGAVAVSAMILPGVSGSLLLVILGQYTRLSTTLTRFIDALAATATGANADGLSDHAAVVGTFAIGGLVGLFTVSRVIRFALDRNPLATMTFLVALVVGALRAPVERVSAEVGFSTDVAISFALAASVGTAALLLLDWYAVDLDLDTVETSR